MKFKPSFEEALKLTKDYRSIPVTLEIFSDVKTPVQVLKILKEAGHHCFLLESAEKSQKWGRYSFLGFNPKTEVSCINGVLTIVDENGEETIHNTLHPEEFVKQIIDDNKMIAILNSYIKEVVFENKSLLKEFIDAFKSKVSFIRYFDARRNINGRTSKGIIYI